MKIKYLNWVRHDGNPIYTIDIHPHGIRFATGGNDNNVRIWRYPSSNLNNSNNNNNNNNNNSNDSGHSPKHRQLFLAKGHAGCVQCVRWSHSGEFLASGSTDQSVIIWKLTDPNYNRKEFGSDDFNYEKWTAITQINRVHEKDVLDLCWSPCSTLIATCSIDNSITIIHPFTPHPIHKTLTQHISCVKGVSWDPTGKFLASASDEDLIIWNIQENFSITKRFVNSFSKVPTDFRRLSWSPDGGMLAVPCGKGETGVVLDRSENWKEKLFKGHSDLVTNAKWNPKMFKDEKKGKIYIFLAFGSRNSSISIWSAPNDLKGPLVCLDKVFQSSIMDMSWGGFQSLSLMACSTSQVLSLDFTTDELGIPIDKQEVEKKIQTFYGESIKTNSYNLAESPYQLSSSHQKNFQMFNPISPSNVSNLIIPNSIPSSSHNQNNILNPSSITSSSIQQNKSSTVQTETKLPSGKRRITPIIIESPNAPTNSIFSNPPSNAVINGNNNNNIPLRNEINVQHSQSLFENLVTPKSPYKSPLIQYDSNSQTEKSKKTKTNFSTNKTINFNEKRKNLSDEQHQFIRPEKQFKKDQPILSIPSNQTKLTDSLYLPDSLKTRMIEVTQKKEKFCSHLSCYISEKLIWSEILEGLVNLISQNNNYVVCASKQGSIYLFSSSGSKLLLPCLIFGESLSYLQLSRDNSFLLAIGVSGKTKVWDLINLKLLYSTSITDLIRNDYPCIIDINGKGQTLIILENSNHAFVFHSDMKVWCKVSDDFYLASEFINMNRHLQDSKLPLARIQYARSSTFPIHSEKKISISHLKNQVSASLLLESPIEYQQWLSLYVRRLTEEGENNMLEELCLDLLGSEDGLLFAQLSRHSILFEILPIMNENRSLQKLVNQMNESLEKQKNKKD